MDWWSFSFCVGIKCVEFMDYVKNYLGADKGKNNRLLSAEIDEFSDF